MKNLLILLFLSLLSISFISSTAQADTAWGSTDADGQTTEMRIPLDISAAGIPSYFSLIPDVATGIFFNSSGNFVNDAGFLYDSVANDLSVLNNMEASNYCDEAGANCFDPADGEFTSLIGLTSAADKGIQFTGAGTAATYDLTTTGKALLDDANTAAQRTTLGLVIGTDVQAEDAVLTDLAALGVIADNEIIVGTGAGTYANEGGATARTSLGLAIGTDVQAFDANNALTDVAQEYTAQQNFNATTLTALGVDLVVNGTCVSDTTWTKGTGWTIASGVCNSDASQSADSDLTQAISFVNGSTYQIIFTVANRTAGNIVPVVGDQEGTDVPDASGIFTQYIIAGAGSDFDMRADLDWDGDIDNITAKLTNVSWDVSANQVTSLTLDGNLILDNPTNQVDGATYIITLIQDGTGTRLLTYGSVYKFPGGTAPTLTTAASAKDILTCVSNGTNMNCVFQADFK